MNVFRLDASLGYLGGPAGKASVFSTAASQSSNDRGCRQGSIESRNRETRAVRPLDRIPAQRRLFQRAVAWKFEVVVVGALPNVDVVASGK
jgi:hypothetical protein